jgi:hypothetical protein
MTTAHLVRRFFGSLRPGGPPAADEAWAQDQLQEGERRLWVQLSGADRRHAVGVARRTADTLGSAADRTILAAALLHDVGKLTSHLGTYGRVVATLAAKVAGRDMARAWSDGRGFTRRVGLYLRHDELGGEMLRVAGSAPLTANWAAEHHLGPEDWTVPAAIGAALKAADDD